MASLIKRTNARGETIFHLKWTEGPRGCKIVRWKKLGPIDEKTAELVRKDFEVKQARGAVGFPEESAPLSLKDMIEIYFSSNETSLAPKTLVRYRQFAEHFAQYFGKHPVTSSGLESYKKHRIAQGAKAKTVNNELVWIRTVYGPRGSHPFRDVKDLPLHDSKEPRWLTHEELQTFLDAAADDAQREIWIAFAWTGARLRELSAVEWRHYHRGLLALLNSKTYRIRHRQKYRHVPVPEGSPLEALLERRKRDRENYPRPFPEPWLLTNTCRNRVIATAKRAGIENMTEVKALRHTYCAHNVMAGIDLRTVQELMGHGDIQTTMIYAHLAPDHKKMAGDVLAKYRTSPPGKS